MIITVIMIIMIDDDDDDENYDDDDEKNYDCHIDDDDDDDLWHGRFLVSRAEGFCGVQNQQKAFHDDYNQYDGDDGDGDGAQTVMMELIKVECLCEFFITSQIFPKIKVEGSL